MNLLDNPKLFIIENSELSLEKAQKALGVESYTIYGYLDTESALKDIFVKKPHLLIVNSDDTDIDGLGMANTLREISKFKKTPILFTSDIRNEMLYEYCYHQGATDIINKNYHHYELRLRVHSMLKQYFLAEVQEKLHHQLEAKAEDLESLNRVLIHDLSNHVTTLKFQIKKLALGEDVTVKLNAIVDHLEDIITHVREMRALETGKKEIQLESVNLLLAIHSAVDSMKVKSEEKGVEIQLDSSEIQGVHVSAQRAPLIHQVFENILSNAIKFCHPGGYVKIHGTHVNQGFLLEIEDNGIGMPLEILKNLFNKYKKTSRPGTQKEKGTGFGMPIVKTYLDLFHAPVNVESTEWSEVEGGDSEHHGTVFRIQFRLA